MKAIIGSVLMIAFSAVPLLGEPNAYPARSGQPKDSSTAARQGERTGDGMLSPRSLAQPKQGSFSPGSGAPARPVRMNEDQSPTGSRQAVSAEPNRNGVREPFSAQDDAGYGFSAETSTGRSPAAPGQRGYGQTPEMTAPPAPYSVPADNGAPGQEAGPGNIPGGNASQNPIETQPLVPRVPDNRGNPVPSDLRPGQPQNNFNGQPPPGSGYR